MSEVKIKNALISVYHKDNLDKIIHKLNSLGVNLISTSGTKDYIESLGVKVIAVEDLTKYPSILGGRVKTLHPNIFGGILARRNNENDKIQTEEYEIFEIDLVIVDLYPFEETINKSSSHEEIIEKIDIGGISLIRAAAKNYKDVVIVSSMNQYNNLLSILEKGNGITTLEERLYFAKEAFNVSSHYDTIIFKYFNKDKIDVFKQSITKSNELRYGENPHQKAMFYGNIDEIFDKLNGKEISYNNLLDIDAAINLISEFEETTFAIIKHNNPCGLATRNSSLEAWKDAIVVDTLSAFGGIIITNSKLDKVTAEEINKMFFEVIIAPDYDEKAIELLKSKKNRIILKQKQYKSKELNQFRTILNGVLLQEKDSINIIENKFVTKETPNENELEDLLFANKIVKHSKSNAIVIAKNKQLIASGIGQTSRIDALNQAIEKAKSRNINIENSVLASDAYFPFADSVESAHKAGIKAIIQPGGSVRDNDSIEYCNKNGVKMVMTEARHFKH